MDDSQACSVNLTSLSKRLSMWSGAKARGVGSSIWGTFSSGTSIVDIGRDSSFSKSGDEMITGCKGTF